MDSFVKFFGIFFSVVLWLFIALLLQGALLFYSQGALEVFNFKEFSVINWIFQILWLLLFFGIGIMKGFVATENIYNFKNFLDNYF